MTTYTISLIILSLTVEVRNSSTPWLKLKPSLSSSQEGVELVLCLGRVVAYLTPHRALQRRLTR